MKSGKDRDDDTNGKLDERIAAVSDAMTLISAGSEWWEERGYDPKDILYFSKRSLYATMLHGGFSLTPEAVIASITGTLMIGYELGQRDAAKALDAEVDDQLPADWTKKEE